jgi:hypothetical protein|tara:strand:- start:833 stop:1282 length:450 start_codon:yes stop_codon:yes gene_type:complete
MSNTKRVKLRKGTEQEHTSFAGVLAEVTVDTDKKTLRVHDGSTQGGFEVSKARYELLTSAANVRANVKYFTDTTGGAFTITLPSIHEVGDYISAVDAESNWDINNLTVVTQNSETFKDHSGLIDSPLVCDVAGAVIELIWEGNYWRLIA